VSRLTAMLLTFAACTRGPGGGTADSGLPPVTDSDTPTVPDTIDVSACLAGPDQAGPWDDHPITLAGATTTSDAPAVDAGLAAVVAAADGQLDPFTLSPPLVVTGAVVTATDYVPAINDGTGSFWLEDAQSALTTFRVTTVPGIDPAALVAGDVVSFEATEVQDFFGVIEITAVQNFAVTGTAPVHVVDGNAGLDVDTMLMRTVEVWGGLSSDPSPCGGDSVCFDFDYNGGTALFRTESTFDEPGDCIHYIGPLSLFKGGPQVDARNFDWYQAY
jgi:hypothetical protein